MNDAEILHPTSPEEKYFREGLGYLWVEERDKAFVLLKKAAKRYHAPSLFLLSLFLENPSWGFVAAGEDETRLSSLVEATNLKNQCRSSTNGTLEQWKLVRSFVEGPRLGVSEKDPQRLNNLGWIDLCMGNFFDSTRITASWELEEIDEEEDNKDKTNEELRLLKRSKRRRNVSDEATSSEGESDWQSGEKTPRSAGRKAKRKKEGGAGRGRAQTAEIPPDYIKTIQLFQAAADAGLPAGNTNLGFLCEVCFIVTQSARYKNRIQTKSI